MGELLADHTTLRLGGPADDYMRCTDPDRLVETVADADRDGTPVLLLGGGSNVVVADEGFPGLVVDIATRGVEADVSTGGAPESCGGVLVTVAAGEDWDELVGRAVTE